MNIKKTLRHRWETNVIKGKLSTHKKQGEQREMERYVLKRYRERENIREFSCRTLPTLETHLAFGSPVTKL